ncbi:rho GTPase-activating 11A isoform X1 [Pelobates cultripes]|uniref:Rho GTPase-activating 11A isoform X1 n=1 Tax=Pelobates cultripes TaxID=61616 RepID=A0AAD1TJD2_PELCU|nr:rho GTPase-activating 11A isoform X1 [Pelobates cultripes]
MKQSPDYPNLARLAVIQHLRSYGIKIKHWNCKQRPDTGKGQPSGKVFGTALHALPQIHVQDYGTIPNFLVDVCNYLELHAHTEGLFRKSGSVMRQKLLKAKLDSGGNGLSDAPPCDVAGILKQFFRELPEPILPAELQDSLFKAQNLANNEDRVSATLLISCLIPERFIHILRYIFYFLHTVSKRSDANKMDSSNLAVVFAPNLLQSNDDNEKISSSTEKKLRVQTEVVRTLIDHATNIGCVPHFLLEKIPGMLGVDGGTDTPGREASEGCDVDPLQEKKRRRRSVGDYVSGALNKLITNRTPSSTPQSERPALGSMVTPLILTPSVKRKLPTDSAQGFSTKKRKSIKNSLGFELLPNSLFGSGSTPASACFESPHTSFEASHNSLSPLVTTGKHLSNSSMLRRSKRVDSGKTGCFSPKISRKEMVRRSLRLRFSLGKSSKDVSTSGTSSNLKSQNIGWRLANSQELTPVTSSHRVETLSFPIESPFVSAGTKLISKSEDNLLSPKPSDESSHRKSWTGPQPFKLDGICDENTPVAAQLWATHCYSEPVLVSGKPPSMPKLPGSLNEVYRQDQNKNNDSLCEEEVNLADNTAMRISKAFTQSGTDLHRVMTGDSLALGNVSNLESEVDFQNKSLESGKSASVFDSESVSEEGITQGEVKDKLRTDAVTSPAGCCENSLIKEPLAISITEPHNTAVDTSFTELSQCQQSCIKEVVLLNSPELFSKTISSTAQVNAVQMQVDRALVSHQKDLFPPSDVETSVNTTQDCHIATSKRNSNRVSDQIQLFNSLCLSDSSSVQKLKSPIKFQRTPVRQSVRRINSLSEVVKPVNVSSRKQSTASLPMMKSVSSDSSLSSELPYIHSNRSSPTTNVNEASVPHKTLNPATHLVVSSKLSNQLLKHIGRSVTNTTSPSKSVFEDLTNQDIPKTSYKRSDLSLKLPDKYAARIVSGRERHRYKGSPRNPIGRLNFLPSSKPLDL